LRRRFARNIKSTHFVVPKSSASDETADTSKAIDANADLTHCKVAPLERTKKDKVFFSSSGQSAFFAHRLAFALHEGRPERLVTLRTAKALFMERGSLILEVVPRYGFFASTTRRAIRALQRRRGGLVLFTVHLVTDAIVGVSGFDLRTQNAHATPQSG